MIYPDFTVRHELYRLDKPSGRIRIAETPEAPHRNTRAEPVASASLAMARKVPVYRALRAQGMKSLAMSMSTKTTSTPEARVE